MYAFLIAGGADAGTGEYDGEGDVPAECTGGGGCMYAAAAVCGCAACGGGGRRTGLGLAAYASCRGGLVVMRIASDPPTCGRASQELSVFCLEGWRLPSLVAGVGALLGVAEPGCEPRGRRWTGRCGCGA